MSSCVLIVKENCLQGVLEELQEEIIEHSILLNIVTEENFNLMIGILKEDKPKKIYKQLTFF